MTSPSRARKTPLKPSSPSSGISQSEGRVGEVERPVGAVDEVVGRVQPLALVAVRQHRDVAVRVDADDAPVAVLADRQQPGGREREAVRAGLVVAADVRAGVSALGAEHGHGALLPAVDGVRVRRAEEQRTVRGPDGALGELEAAGDALEPAVGGQDAAQIPLDLKLGRPGDGSALGSVEVERCRSHPDVVPRRGRDRPVDAEDGDRERLARPRIACQHDAVGRVEAPDRPTAGVADRDRQLAVHPDLCVVVDHDLEDHGRAGRVEVADPLGDRHVDLVPVEADAPVGEAQPRLAGAQAAQRAPSRTTS